MMTKNSQSDYESRRRFIRIPLILPVDYQLLSERYEALEPEVRTGFTSDLSENGLCLKVRNLPQAIIDQLNESNETPLRIAIDIPLAKRTIRTSGRVVWTQERTERTKKYRLLGVEFQNLTRGDAESVLQYAKREAARPKYIKLGILLLACALIFTFGNYVWKQKKHEADMAEAEQALAVSNNEINDVSSELARLTHKLHLLAKEMKELESDLNHDLHQTTSIPKSQQDSSAPRIEKEGDNTEPDIMKPVVDELMDRIQEIRTTMLKIKEQKQTDLQTAFENTKQ